MNIGNFILPALLIAIFVAALIKKVPAFDKFTEGAKKSLVVIFNIFPFLVAVFISIELFNKSGATDALVSAISPVFNIIGIPSSLVKLILVKPFSASASMVVLDEIFTTYGPDSFMGVAASIIMSSSDAVFYITAVYFATTNVRKLHYAIPVALATTLFSAQLAVLIAWIVV